MKDMQEFEQVTLHFEGCCSYSDSWTPGEPFPQGWGPESEARQFSYVNTSDYDALLAYTKGLHQRAAIVYQHNKELIEQLEEAIKKVGLDAK